MLSSLWIWIFVIFSGADHLKLIFDYAEWVLKEHPEDGLKVGLTSECLSLKNVMNEFKM